MPLMNYEKQMKNAGHVFRVQAMHIKDINGEPDFVEFFPYIEGYTENYDSSWSEEDVFGRMDGIANFASVKRSFSISLRIAAGSLEQARENQFRLSKLIRFLYPSLTPGPGDGSFYFRGAPILKLKLGNVIADSNTNTGLFGYIQGGLSITPSHKDGWFAPQKEITIKTNGILSTSPVQELREDAPKDGQSEKAVTLFFKYVDISFTFKVLHNHPLGTNSHEASNVSSFSAFPYGINASDFANGSELNPADLTTPIQSINPGELTVNDLNGLPVGTSPVGLILDEDDQTEYTRQILNSIKLEQDEVSKRVNKRHIDILNGMR